MKCALIPIVVLVPKTSPRPRISRALLRHTLREQTGYRTSPRTLRRLASGHMLFELPGETIEGLWDTFEARNIGLNVQQRMARDFEGEPDRLRKDSLACTNNRCAR